MAKFDVAVLGAGIVGICSAIHLQRAGLSVALVDRREPGMETSFGNAGIIQREGVHPYLFPRNVITLARHALNRGTEAHYHLSALAHVAPFLFRYWRASRPDKARATLAANIPLFAECLSSHGELADAAGAGNLIAKNGWLRLLRDDSAMSAAEAELAELCELGLVSTLLAKPDLAQLEPHLRTDGLAGAVHHADPWTVSDPGALVSAYAALFEKEGGTVVCANAFDLSREAGGSWFSGVELQADRIVVALGPWSEPFLDKLGVKLPMGIKRGYHRHYRGADGATLTRSVVDDANGFVLAPMRAGIRLTSGAEFARLDAPPTPVQLERALPKARQLLALGEPVEEEPWMGARPAFPDMRPVIGSAPGRGDVWINTGHAHHGFTLGPASGRLLSQMMTGGEPLCDPAPFSAARFG